MKAAVPGREYQVLDTWTVGPDLAIKLAVLGTLVFALPFMHVRPRGAEFSPLGFAALGAILGAIVGIAPATVRGRPAAPGARM